MLPSNQKQMIEQAKFTYSPFGKSVRKTNKNNWRSRKKQIEALIDLQSKEQTKVSEGKSDEKLSMQKET